jgi:hypothetical protein
MKNRGLVQRGKAECVVMLKSIKKEIKTLKPLLNELREGQLITSPDKKPGKQRRKVSEKGKEEIANSGQPPFLIFCLV